VLLGLSLILLGSEILPCPKLHSQFLRKGGSIG